MSVGRRLQKAEGVLLCTTHGVAKVCPLCESKDDEPMTDAERIARIESYLGLLQVRRWLSSLRTGATGIEVSTLPSDDQRRTDANDS